MIRFRRLIRSLPPVRRGRRPLPRCGRRASAEGLERRVLLAADSAGLARIAWQGRLVDVHADAWIARADALPAGDLGLAPGWSARSLGEGFFSLAAPAAGVADVLGWAATTPGVAYVEPDFAIAPRLLPADPTFGSLWGLHNTGQSGGLADADIDAPEAWDTTTGSRDVVIAVVDTGVDLGHPDLAANAWRNPGEVPGDRIDNDGNGFVDDVSGWDFANGDADAMDDNGHGTHVAGTIGAAGGNGTGVVGVNWRVSIMPLKFLSGSGEGSTSGAIAAINYATRMKRDFGVRVVATNNSWGGGGFSAALRDAIAAGWRQDILFVAAAGNDGTDNDAQPHHPSNDASPAVISVAASDRSNRLAGFSNYGAASVDLAAPGVGITSTLPGNRYGSYSGTSMATPHVAGVVGLLAAANPAATAAEVRAAILSTTTPVAGFAGRMATGGLLNAAAAVAAILPAAPGDPLPDPVDPGPVVPEPPAGPTVDIVDVSPDPRTTAVEAITITFSTPVRGFDLGDLVLLRNGTSLPLDGATLRSDDDRGFTLGGLAPLTTTAGDYTLVLTAAGSGIETVGDGLPLAADAADGWTMEAAAIEDVGQVFRDAARIPEMVGDLRISGIVGDGRHGGRDVDMYRIRVRAGQPIVIDVDARSLPGGSSLDSFIRVFDVRGRQLAANDDSRGSVDSRLAIRPRSDTFLYVGVSGYGNSRYDPQSFRSARAGSTGAYQLALSFGAVPQRGRLDAAAAVRVLGFAEADGQARGRNAIPGPRRQPTGGPA